MTKLNFVVWCTTTQTAASVNNEMNCASYVLFSTCFSTHACMPMPIISPTGKNAFCIQSCIGANMFFWTSLCRARAVISPIAEHVHVRVTPFRSYYCDSFVAGLAGNYCTNNTGRYHYYGMIRDHSACYRHIHKNTLCAMQPYWRIHIHHFNNGVSGTSAKRTIRI